MEDWYILTFYEYGSLDESHAVSKDVDKLKEYAKNLMLLDIKRFQNIDAEDWITGTNYYIYGKRNKRFMIEPIASVLQVLE